MKENEPLESVPMGGLPRSQPVLMGLITTSNPININPIATKEYLSFNPLQKDNANLVGGKSSNGRQEPLAGDSTKSEEPLKD